LSFEGAFGSAGGGAMSAGLKSGIGGFDCFREKIDLHVPDFDLRRCGSLRGAADAASVLLVADGSAALSSLLFKVGRALIGVVIDRFGFRGLSKPIPGVE